MLKNAEGEVEKNFNNWFSLKSHFFFLHRGAWSFYAIEYLLKSYPLQCDSFPFAIRKMCRF